MTNFIAFERKSSVGCFSGTFF